MQIKKPEQSLVQIAYTMLSNSVQRKHPTHYVSEGEAKFLVYPQSTKDTSPEKAGKPKVIGKAHFWNIQLRQATFGLIQPHELLVDPLSSLKNLISPSGAFREDLLIQPCNCLFVIDSFDITNELYDHESLKFQIIDEISQTLCYSEVVVVDVKKSKINPKTFNKMSFVKITGTDYAVRDNCIYHAKKYQSNQSPVNFLFLFQEYDGSHNSSS